MSDGLNTILNSDDKQIGTARNVLSRLWRRILFAQGINPLLWEKMMVRYLNDPLHNIPPTGNRRSSARGNLQKELSRPSMTWKVFQKAMRFLNPKRVRFMVEITWWSNRVTTYAETLDLHALDLDETEQTLDDWTHTVGPHDGWYYPHQRVFQGTYDVGETAHVFCPYSDNTPKIWEIREPGGPVVLAQYGETTRRPQGGVGI